MTIKLIFCVEMSSDYHVGMGQRGGPLVDAALLRDHDNAPILRGSALVGLLREGLRELVDIMPAGMAIKEKGWVKEAKDNIFGSATHPKRWFFGSARPLQTVDSYNKKYGRWGAQDVTRVRVNPRTRRVSPQKLFVQEEGDGRLQFTFSATCYSQQARDEADALLLIAASRMVHHLGAARRRGRGQCQIRLIGATGLAALQEADEDHLLDTALAAFRDTWLEGTSLPKWETQEAQTLPEMSKKRLRFRIAARAIEPIIISKRSEVGNAFETLDVILGTAVLGALAYRAAHTLGLQGDGSPEFVQLFQRGGLQVTSLMPALYENSELIPAIAAPKSFLQCENFPFFSGGNIVHPRHDIFAAEVPDKCPECGGKLKGVDGYLTVAEYPEQYAVKFREEPHIRVEHRRQRVNEREGGLFEYIAIEAGQWFVGELACDAAHWQRIQELTGLTVGQRCELRVGKGTRRGYGLLHLTLEVADDSPLVWAKRPLSARLPNPITSSFTLLLLTDTIIADSWGRHYTGFAEAWLTRQLNVKGVQVKLLQQNSSSRIVDSFNTNRRMPRYRDQAIVAGSVCQIELAGVDESNKGELRAALKRWEQEGVGWRRFEGFGRVAINHPIFSPDDDLDDSLFQVESLAMLLSESGLHPLQGEADFRQQWQKNLEERQWGEIKPEYETLARLIYLQREQPLATLLAWLADDALGQPNWLWGEEKPFPARDKESRIDREFLRALRQWLTQELTPLSDRERAIAVTMTADYLAAKARPLKE